MSKPIVKELWMLWHPESDDWVIAVDDPDPHIAYLCAKSKEAIVALQAHQRINYEVISIPVRII